MYLTFCLVSASKVSATSIMLRQIKLPIFVHNSHWDEEAAAAHSGYMAFGSLGIEPLIRDLQSADRTANIGMSVEGYWNEYI